MSRDAFLVVSRPGSRRHPVPQAPIGSCRLIHFVSSLRLGRLRGGIERCGWILGEQCSRGRASSLSSRGGFVTWDVYSTFSTLLFVRVRLQEPHQIHVLPSIHAKRGEFRELSVRLLTLLCGRVSRRACRGGRVTRFLATAFACRRRTSQNAFLLICKHETAGSTSERIIP